MSSLSVWNTTDKQLSRGEPNAVHLLGFPPEPVIWSVSEYVEHCGEAIAVGRLPPPAVTHAEREAAVAEWPHLSHYWRPAETELVREGISRNFGRDPEPFNVEFCERFIMSMNKFPEFAMAIYCQLEAIGAAEGGAE